MLTRLAICACFLLLTSAFANAQAPDPLDRVITELQAGRHENALAALDEVIKKYPKNPDAYLLRGSLKMQDDPAQALRDFDKVVELKPDSGEAYHQRAFIRLVNNDTVGALKDLDAAISHNFSDDSTYYLRGQLRWQAGDTKAALSDLNEAIKLNPNNPRVYSIRANLLLALNEPERALADFNYLLSWYETDPSARRARKSSESAAGNSQSQPSAAPKAVGQPFVVHMTQQTDSRRPVTQRWRPRSQTLTPIVV